MNILDTIIEYKKSELRKRKSDVSIRDLEKRPGFTKAAISLEQSLRNPDKNGIIAEFKRKSPSKGILNATADVIKITKAYTKNNAAGLSVLTDEHFFGGSIDDLLAARVNKIPLLRKEFIIDEYQVVETKSLGADVILLIANVLSQTVTKRLADLARNIGLEVLLEIHSEKELNHITDSIDMVGVNNRNLKSFEVDVATSFRLISSIPSGKIAVSESGIHDAETIHSLKNAGFKGFLIGERFMKEADPTIAFAEFVQQLKAKQ